MRWLLVAAAIFGALILGGGVVAIVFSTMNRPVANEGQGTPTPAPASPAESPSPGVEPARANLNLGGEWQIINTIEETSYPAYQNLRIGYRIYFNQTGNQFTGEGEKDSEDDQTLQGVDRTPIHVTGSIDRNTIGATFVEEGARRKTSGRFSWTLSDNGNKLDGTFSSSAASASGPSMATRLK